MIFVKRWLTFLLALNNDQNMFICVGSAHVFGEGGMADLLTQRGYTVEQVQ